MNENATRGAGSAPGGVTGGDDTTSGVDNSSAASISGPARHPGAVIEGGRVRRDADSFDQHPTDDTDSGDETTDAEDSGSVDVPDRSLPEHEVLRALATSFEDSEWSVSHGQDVVRIPAGLFAEFGRAARDAGFEMCVDVTAVDWLRKRRVRFEVVANLLSQQHVLRLRVITAVGDDDPTVPSLTPIWPGANFAERETYDMFGIVFDGHPDLTRILMPDEWEGYPLRKDFSTGSVPVQFKESHKVT